MANRSLADFIRELIDSERMILPLHPGVARQVSVCLAGEGTDATRLWSLVGQEPALLCGLFRAANSSFFAGLERTVSIREAVARLGSDKAVQVIHSTFLASASRRQGPLLPRYLPALWRHALGCAVGPRWLAVRCACQAQAEQAYLAGLLHDIGKYFLLAAFEESLLSGEFEGQIADPLVMEVLTTMHTEQGVRLLREWHLAEGYVNAVADHHGDRFDSRDTLVALVRLANKGCHKLGLGLARAPDLLLSTCAEAQFLGIDEIALAELEIMLEDRFLIEQGPFAADQPSVEPPR